MKKYTVATGFYFLNASRAEDALDASQDCPQVLSFSQKW